MEECLFCKFVKGEIKPEIIYEDNEFLAFLDKNPMHPGHTLLIPKEHIDYFFDIEDEMLCKYMKTAKIISEKLRKSMKTEKVGLAVEGFLVRHAHLHLIPINPGMAIDPCLQKEMDSKKLKEIAEKIRAEFK
jgi:histidine triad (HIT) family protein